MKQPNIKDDTMRCGLSGFKLLSMHDLSGRRGLWARFLLEGREVLVPSEHYCYHPPSFKTVELISGREGDDAHVSLVVGETITQEKLDELVMVLARAAGEVEAARDLK